MEHEVSDDRVRKASGKYSPRSSAVAGFIHPDVARNPDTTVIPGINSDRVDRDRRKI
jgi:hypothetical protein